MEKPKNIIDLTPILQEARRKEKADQFANVLKSAPGHHPLPDKIQKAIDETRNVKVDGARD